MFQKRLVGLVFAGGLVFNAAAAEVIVRITPPRAVYETRGPRPVQGQVWVGGYHRWNGNAYVWGPGRWEAPPHHNARWVSPHWVHRHGGYVLVEGRWR